MNRTTLMPVAVYLVVAAWGFGITSPVEAFQAESENLWLLLLQKAELENTYDSDHPKVASLADRIQSARERLSTSASAAPGTNSADDSGGNISGVHVPSAPRLPSSTVIDRDAVPAAPATDAAMTIEEDVSQDLWIVRVYDVSLLRPSFEAAAAARNIAIQRLYSGDNPAHSGGLRGGGSGFFQISGTRGERADSVEPSAKPDDNAPGSVDSANQETPLAVTWQECLMELVQDLTSPVAKWSAVDGEGSVRIIEHHLIVRQTRLGHEQVADLLNQLTLSLTNTDAAVPSNDATRLPINPVTEFSRGIDRDSEQKLNEMLWTERTPELRFPGENELLKILNHISAVLSSRVGHPVVIMTDIGALEDDSVVLDDVFIRDIDIPEGLLTVGSAIKHILSQTDPELSLIARDGILVLTTKTSADAEENSLLRVYDISGILAALRNPQSLESVDPWQIPEIVQAMSAPPARWYDIDGEGGRLYTLGERLVVTQSPEGHQRIADCLEQLELSLNAAAFGSQSEPVMGQPLNPIREFTQESERHAESRLHEFLWSERNPELHFPGETTLLKVLAVVSEKLSKPVLFKPDFIALEAEKISSLDDVKIKDLNVDAGRMSIGAALDEILSQTTPKLSWIVKNNMVLLTSLAIAESEENQYLRIYDVSRIRALTATTGAKVFPSGASICSVISHMTTPVCRWFETDGEGGRMVIAGDQLIVRQTRHGHQLVADILTRLVMPGRQRR